MSLTFFGTDYDISEVWKWMLAIPDMVIFEEYSVPDKPNRTFETLEALSSHLTTPGASLAGWPRSVGGEPQIQKMTFDSNTQRRFKARGRTILHSPAIIRISRNNDQRGCLASGSISSWTEKGARSRSIYSDEFLDEVNWKKFRSIVRKVERQITKVSPAKMGAHAIMPDAFEKFRNGQIKLWNWGDECVYPSPLITEFLP